MWQTITAYAGVALTGLGVLVSVAGVIGSWVLTLIGMPGNWCIVLLAVGYELLLAPAGRLELGWPVIWLLIALAVAGELLEAATGVVGVAKTGGSRRSATAALIGSFAGGILARPSDCRFRWPDR